MENNERLEGLKKVSENGLAIKMPSDRPIRIAHFTDIHFGVVGSGYHNNRPERTKAYMQYVVDTQKPDFIVCTGDIIMTTGVEKLGEFVALMESYKIPWTFVFGNHDACILVDGALTCTENQAHLQHYFKNIYARRTNNYGYFTVKDDYFNVKYVVLSAFNNGVGTLDAKQLDLLIDTLKENDGYDVVIVAHMPLLADSSKWNFPTDTTYDGTGYRWCNADTDALFAARKAKTSGSVTDANGVAHPYDFSDCTTEMLCSIHGHTHADAYLYLDDFLVNTFDMFTDSTFFMVLIDRENRQLNVWKVCNPDTGATYQNYQIPLDKPAE